MNAEKRIPLLQWLHISPHRRDGFADGTDLGKPTFAHHCG